MDIQEYLAAHEERDNKADEEANRKLVQVARQEARLAAKQRQVNNLDMIKNRLQVLRDKFKEKEEALQKFEKAAKEALQNSEGQVCHWNGLLRKYSWLERRCWKSKYISHVYIHPTYLTLSPFSKLLVRLHSWRTAEKSVLGSTV